MSRASILPRAAISHFDDDPKGGIAENERLLDLSLQPDPTASVESAGMADGESTGVTGLST